MGCGVLRTGGQQVSKKCFGWRDSVRTPKAEALVPFGELVMFMPMEKPKDKGEVWNRVGFMLGLVDRS